MTPSSLQPLLILRLGQPHAHIAAELGGFDQWMRTALGPCERPITVIDPRDGTALPAPGNWAGIIMTGSHSMVSEREAWSEQTAAWLRLAVAADVPVLGICYGHQLLAHALGGEVDYHPGGIELGTVDITLTAAAQNDALLAGLPTTFAVQASHRQSVRRLPDGAVLLAGNTFEPHHAFRFGRCAWGLQFHPEFSVAATLGYARVAMPDATPPVFETPIAALILPRFVHVVNQGPCAQPLPSLL